MNHDSVITQIRKDAKPGCHTVHLIDNRGKTYITGYQTPERFTHDSAYPLIVYLHGGIGTQSNSKGENAYEMFSFLADSIPVFLASPSANRFAPWWSPQGLGRITQTVRHMTLHYPIDSSRIFLAGVSDGATGCYAAANTICGPFAGFIAVSGFGGMLPQLGLPLHPENLMHRPMYNIHAENDRLYPVEAVEKFLDYLEQHHVDIHRKVYPNEEHGFAYRHQEIDSLLHVLRTWSRPTQEKLAWNFVAGYPNIPGPIPLWNKDRAQNEPGQIKGYWKDDTLFINSQGISSVVIQINQLNCGRSPIYFSVNGTRKKIKPDNANCNQKLQIMQNRLYPKIIDPVIYHMIF